MKLRQGTVMVEEGDDFGVKYSAKINADKMSKMFSLLSSIYKDPIGSIVREYTSNCVDANIESGSTEPVIVKFSEDSGGDYIAFIDSGLGLSPEKMFDVFMNYGTSTKENDDNMIGHFGIGSKSSLSYQDSFHIITCTEGIKYHYIYSKGEKGIPTCEEISREECLSSGTTIKIYIKNNYDAGKFKEACSEQLMYFDNVYVENCNHFSNNYKIFQGNTFKINTGVPTIELHIAFGRVYYPIDWNKLKRDRIMVPFGLKFNIGELTPIPSREDIEYTRESIDLINSRIDEFIAEIKVIYEGQREETEDLFKYINDDDFTVSFSDGDVNGYRLCVNIKELDVPSKLILKGYTEKEADLLTSNSKQIESLFNNFFEPKHLISKGRVKTHNWVGNFFGILNKNYWKYNGSEIYRFNVDKLELNKNRFISQDKDAITIGSKYGKFSSVRHLLYHYNRFLGSFSKDEKKTLIRKLTKFVRSYIEERTLSYKDIHVTKEFLDSLKSKKKEIDKTKINVRGVNGFFETSYYDLSKFKEVIYVPAGEDIYSVHSVIREFNRGKKRDFIVISVAKPIYEKLEKMDNCITPTVFKQRHQKYLDKKATYIAIELFERRDALVLDHIRYYSPVYKEYILELERIKNQCSPYRNVTDYSSGTPDPYAMELISRLKLVTNKLKLLRLIPSHKIEDKDVIEYFKLNKVRMTNEAYKQLNINFDGNQEEEIG